MNPYCKFDGSFRPKAGEEPQTDDHCIIIHCRITEKETGARFAWLMAF